MHRKIAQKYVKTTIVPFCKNKSGDTSHAGIYRPVSLAKTISELFEHCIVSCISPFSATTGNQFGFKPQHGTFAFFYSNIWYHIIYANAPQCFQFLDASKGLKKLTTTCCLQNWLSTINAPSGVGGGEAAVASAPQKFWFVKNPGKIPQNPGKKWRPRFVISTKGLHVLCERKFLWKRRTNFSGKFGEIREKIFRTPKNLPAPTPMNAPCAHTKTAVGLV